MQVSESPPPEPQPLSWRAKLRALGISAVLAIWALHALPSRPYSHDNLSRGANARFVAGVDHTLEALGWSVSRDRLKQVLIDATTPLVDARNALVEPVKPLFEFAGMGQRWGLFLQNGRLGFAIRVEGKSVQGPWKLLYRPHQQDAVGLDAWLEFRRLRGIYNPNAKQPRKQYEGFVSWLSQKLFAEHPELAAVRVSMERLKLGSRIQANELERVEYESVRTRDGAS